MGSGVNDNIVVIEVNGDGSLHYKLLSINAPTPVEMAKLEDFVLP